MEGPSIHLAAEQLRPFVGRRVQRVDGNSRIGIERFRGKVVREIFAWGKHLVFQFDHFALRVHFMLWGTFAATVNGKSVTGDYRRSGAPRLTLIFVNGEITIWSASLKFIEHARARDTYVFTTDVLSDNWSPLEALKKVRAHPEEEIADVLLDQSIFAGVGNIIKNEVLFRTRTSPMTRVRDLSLARLRAIVADARDFHSGFSSCVGGLPFGRTWKCTAAPSARHAVAASRDGCMDAAIDGASFASPARALVAVMRRGDHLTRLRDRDEESAGTCLTTQLLRPALPQASRLSA